MFCVLSRSVKCDLRNAIQICSLQKLFETIHSRDHAWSSHRQFFWSSSLTLDEWRMLILDYRVTYVCFRSVERRLWCDVRLDEASHQTWRERFIKLDEASHQTWRERLIKLDESDSLNLTKETSSHQTWRKRHLIKLEIVISSNFWKERQSFYFLMSDLMQRRVIWWYEKLNLAEDHFLCEDKCLCEAVMMSERSNESERWYNSAFS